MPCRSSSSEPTRCCVHPEHAFVMSQFSIPGVHISGCLTALERFDMEKQKVSSTASQFSEINLNLAVYDDTEKELPPIQNTRTARCSLREMLIDGVYESQSKAVVTKTIKFFADQTKKRENAKRRAILSRLKLKAKTDMQLKKISKYMAAVAAKEKEKKLQQRRSEMGLPVNLKVKKVYNTIAINKHLKHLRTVRVKSNSTKDIVKLPKIEEKDSFTQETTEPECVKEPDLEVDDNCSYGSFLYSKLGRTDSFTSLSSKKPELNFPPIESVDLSTVPSRPAPRKKESIKVPQHLERFRFMRIKN